MVIAQQQTATWRPTPVRAGDDLFVGLAAEVGTKCAPRAATYDRDNTFVTENYALLRDAGYTRLAIPKELGGLGMSKAASGKGDVLVTYYSLRRTDVDLKAKPDASGAQPQYPVGSLLVAMLNPATRGRLVELRTDKPVDLEPGKSESIINAAVAEMFAKYPTRQK